MNNLWEQIQRESEYTQIGMREIEERAASDIDCLDIFLDQLYALIERIKDGDPEILRTFGADEPVHVDLDNDDEMKMCLLVHFEYSGPTAKEISYVGSARLGEVFVKKAYLYQIDKLLDEKYAAIKRKYDLSKKLPVKDEPSSKALKI